MTMSSFGGFLKMVREEQGLSIRQLAAQVGVAPSTISRLEAGSSAVPGPDLFLALVDVLGLDVTETMQRIPPYRRLYKRITAGEAD